MKASGYVVISIDGGLSISRSVKIDTDSLFMRVCYDEACITTPHPDQRALMDEILRTLNCDQATDPTPVVGS